ncbi:MAG: hypothetical protein NT154_08305 [Verrucomicrobia bacterium]|nr:hypothetical protein [Verrucomicrobiota bacterium]
MKLVAFLLLLSCFYRCCAETDTNVIAAGEWSTPVVSDTGWPATLRGRLLLYEGRCWTNSVVSGKAVPSWEHVRVYLELQHVENRGWLNPIEVYFEAGSLPCEMRDGLGKFVPPVIVSRAGAFPSPCWITLPCDATVRFRADISTMGGPGGPDSLEIDTGEVWVLPRRATNDFFLSCTFTPPTNRPSLLGYQVWQGTLKLPKVRIPAKP